MNRSAVFAAASTIISDSKEAIDQKNSRHDQVEAGVKKSVTNADMYPWMTEFRTLCKSWAAQRDPSSLIKLMRFFNRNVSSNVNDCYKKSSRAAKLKELIKEALLSFMYYHRFEQPQDQNRAVYLEQMSDLLAMYIDLELVASKRDAEPQYGKISARLVSYLYVYLESSTEHLLDTMIKVQHINESYSHVLDAVISKLWKIVPSRPDSELQYVRYLLVYRLWKRLHSNLAVKKQINTVAIGALGPRPSSLPAELLERVLPAGPPAGLNELQMTKFYLCQAYDLRKACAQFLEYRRPGGLDACDERDPRLKNTLTSDTVKLNNVNSEISKSSNSVNNSNSLKDSINIPFAKLEIDSKKNPSLNRPTSKNSSIARVRPTASSEGPRPRKPQALEGIVLIDLTEEVTKIVKCKKRRRIGWLEGAKRNFDAKIKQASLKKEKKEEPTLKTISELEETSGRASLEVVQAKYEPSRRNETTPTAIPNPPDSSTSSKLVSYDSDTDEEAKAAVKEEETVVVAPLVERADSRIVSSSEAPKQEEEEKPREEGMVVSALRDADTSTKGSQPADSTVSSVEALKEVSSSSERSRIVENAAGACSVIRAAPASPGKLPEPMEDGPVNLTVKTDNYPNKPKVQEEVVAERASLFGIDESLVCVEKNLPARIKREEEESELVNTEQRTEAQAADPEYSQEAQGVNIGEAQYGAESSELPTTSSGAGFYDIPESEIDGLTLLASVSAQQQLTTSKKIELKVKPYSSLQQPAAKCERPQVFNRVVGLSPEDATDKVAFQVEVSSSELVSTSGKSQQDQDTSSADLMSYMLDEQLQGNLENNENANVILNGETVMLLQKSPNSNLYIINKADKVGKMNYDSEEEEAAASKLAEPEDTKCYQQGMMIKPDPDYPKPNVVVPCPFMDCFCGAWKCINRAAQSVQRLPPIVHSKACSMRAEAAAMLAKLYNDQLLCDMEKGQVAAEVEQDVVSRYLHLKSKLPLKKRLKAQMMLSMDLGSPAVAEPSFNSEQVSTSYPGTLMMSIADVEVRSENPPHELGAVVEVSSATAKPATKSRGSRKEKAVSSGKSNNQNVPNCFPRKSSSGKKKRLATDEEVENSAASAAKKSRKSSGSAASTAKQTRSSKRIVPTVNYVYPEIDPECNPSGKRKKKRSSRWTTAKAS